MAAAPALAKCKTVVKVAGGDDSQTQMPQMKADGCTHSFAVAARANPVEASIVAKPAHGILDRVGATTFAYFPQAGYKGADSYEIRVCGAAGSGTGCTTVSFEATIR